MRTLLILLGSILHLACTACPADYNPKDMRSGFVVASTVTNVDANIKGNTTTYIYKFNSSLPSTPQVAIATNMIQGPLRNDQRYSVSAAGSQSQVTFTITLSYSSNNWYIMKIGFLAETRSDMEAGVVQMSNLTSQIKTYNQTLSKSISEPFVRTFIAGFLVGGSNQAPSFSQVSASASGNVLSLAVQADNLGTVWMSYVVYSSNSLKSVYRVSSGSVGVGVFTTNLSQLEAGTTFIYGFSQFDSSSTTYFHIDSRLSPQLSMNSTTKTLASANIDYLIVQTLPKSYCPTCDSGNIYELGYCVTNCGIGSVPIISQGAQMCMACDLSSYLIVNIDSTTCTCAVQYYQPPGSVGCLPCHSSCITCTGPSAKNCSSCDDIPSVGTKKVLVNSSCVCLQRFYEDPSNTFFCVPCHYSCLTCSGAVASNCLSCSLNLGRVKSGNTCNCTAGYKDDGKNQKCVCINATANGTCIVPITCQANQVAVNNSCQCKSGFFNISGNCSQCQSSQYFNGASCIACTNGTVSEDKTKCNCNSGFFNISGKCQKCPSNQVYNNNSQSCACASGFYRVSGTCQKPPANTTYNGTAFVCSPGFYNISGKCTVCQGDQIYNTSSKTCVCPPKTTLKNGRCQIVGPPPPPTGSCPSNASPKGGSCTCNQGFYNISGTCIACPQGTSFNGSVCSCPPNTYLSGNACVACPGGSTSNGVTCICPTGQTFINNTCKPTTTNTTNTTNPPGTKITATIVGYQKFPGYIVVRVALSYIPPALLADNCAACSNLLNVNFTGGTAKPVSIKFSFSPPNIINIFFAFNTSAAQPFTGTVKLQPSTFLNAFDISDTLNLNITSAIISSAKG